MEDPLVYGRNHVTPVPKVDQGATSRDNSSKVHLDFPQRIPYFSKSFSLFSLKIVLPFLLRRHISFFPVFSLRQLCFPNLNVDIFLHLPFKCVISKYLAVDYDGFSVSGNDVRMRSI